MSDTGQTTEATCEAGDGWSNVTDTVTEGLFPAAAPDPEAEALALLQRDFRSTLERLRSASDADDLTGMRAARDTLDALDRSTQARGWKLQ